MKITIAKDAGYCFGVRDAVNIAYDSAEKHGDVYMLGSIVHNEKVVNDLKNAGAKIVTSLDDVPKESPILFRAHGTVPKLWDEAKEKENVVLIDNRERLNFLEQHIPGSINIPYRTLASDGKILRTKESMRNFLKNRGIPEDAEIITYCGSVGTLSGLAYYALKSIGIPNVKLYVHSFKEWKSLEKPIGKQENASYWDLSAE